MLNQTHLYGCNLSEVEFLKSSSSFPKLSWLGLSRNKFTHLPTCFNKYKYLQHLNVEKCKQLQKIPQLPPDVHVLRADGCRSLQEFPDLLSLSSDCCRIKLSSCRKLYRKGANMAHALSLEGLPKMRHVDICLVGKEMPEWFFHCEDNSASFTVSRDLSDKFLGLALCFVFGPEEEKAVDPICGISILENGERRLDLGRSFHSMKSDHVWIAYYPRRKLDSKGRYVQNNPRHSLKVSEGRLNNFQVFLKVSRGRLIKCGFCPIFEQQEDDLRIVLQPQQPIETNWPLEERDSEEENRMDTEEDESSSETDDELIEAIDQEKEKQGLFKADKIGPSEERDSEEDNWIDTEDEESSIETDEAIDPEEEEAELFYAGKFSDPQLPLCEATEDLCRSYKTVSRKLFLRKEI